MILRTYQEDIFNQLIASNKNCIVQLDTGAGKTAIIAALAEYYNSTLIVAHRKILIEQCSLTLAKFGLSHNTLSTKQTRSACAITHKAKLGCSFIDESAEERLVVSIDSLTSAVKRQQLTLDTKKQWTIIVDEAHHCADKNKWGKLKELFPKARIIGFTATPARLDGKPLKDIFSSIIQAKSLKKNSVKTLIKEGYLTDFEAYSIPADVDQSLLRRSSITKDYTEDSLMKCYGSNLIVSDAIDEYKKLCYKKQAIVMCINITHSEQCAYQFMAAGINASFIHSKLAAKLIAMRIEMFRSKEIQALCNVDMLTEGFDMPEIDALIMLRKTCSLVRFRQWVGRSLRPSSGKRKAILIDHVGNFFYHLLPDTDINWSLESEQIAKKTNVHACDKCHYVFDAWLTNCPKCGEENDVLDKNKRSPRADYTHIDFQLCKIKRQEIAAHEIALAKTKKFKTEVKPLWKFDPDAIGSACNQLAQLFVNANKSDDNTKLNQFIDSIDACTTSFWIKNFTMKDVANNNVSKFQQVFKKWQKQH